MIINLRKATSADIPVLLAIEKSVSCSNLYSPMLEEDEWLTELRQNTVYIIEKDGVAVGNISYEEKDDDHVYISGLVVEQQFQGQGIAREALTHLLENLGAVKRIDLVTHPDNVTALKLYQSFGFISESRKENYFGDGQPRLVLALFAKNDF